MQKCVVVTNNPFLYRFVSSGRFIEGSALHVLLDVRDSLHRGGKLLTHPLCGNLRPYQQPYRSVLTEENPARDKSGFPIDLESISIIENAVLVYRSCEERLALPALLPETLREDYAFVDFELMRESLERYGQLLKPQKLSSVFGAA
ncbi:MAG: GrdX family protein [Synergistaceae bacterium]|jgi:hypothetical protein|nr:GrdX family protein [Synergistaceae bacterium]